MLKILTAPLPASEVNISFVQLCKTFGIHMPADLTVETMTAQQYQLLEQSAEAENAAIKEKMKELQDGVE
jgi:hypothetical protein